MKATTLLLFDIDGTILTTGGCGERALRLAIRDYFGVEDDMKDIEIAGRTDTYIARRLLEKYDREITNEEIQKILARYVVHLGTLLPQGEGRVMPGIVPLLEAMKDREDVSLALLTGNLARGAEMKLTHYGVWHYFRFGAYADDHYDRNQLSPVALTRAREHHGHDFDPGRVFVLGDTPHDIACARVIGAQALAVATGGFTHESLVPHQPDLLFHDLSDVPGVVKAMGL